MPVKKMKHHKEEMLFLFLMSLSYSSELHESKCLAKSNSKIKKENNFSVLKTHRVVSLCKYGMKGGSQNLPGLVNW